MSKWENVVSKTFCLFVIQPWTVSAVGSGVPNVRLVSRQMDLSVKAKTALKKKKKKSFVQTTQHLRQRLSLFFFTTIFLFVCCLF